MTLWDGMMDSVKIFGTILAVWWGSLLFFRARRIHRNWRFRRYWKRLPQVNPNDPETFLSLKSGEIYVICAPEQLGKMTVRQDLTCGPISLD
jgi:hypothetical protein